MNFLPEIKFTVNKSTFSSEWLRVMCYLKKEYLLKIIQFTQNYVSFTWNKTYSK